jgi:hypothetical protein
MKYLRFCHRRKLWRPTRSGVHHRPSPFRLHRCRSLVRNRARWISLSYLFACPVAFDQGQIYQSGKVWRLPDLPMVINPCMPPPSALDFALITSMVLTWLRVDQ